MYFCTASSIFCLSASEMATSSSTCCHTSLNRLRRVFSRRAAPAEGPETCSAREAWKLTTSSFKRTTFSRRSSSKSPGSPEKRFSAFSTSFEVFRPSLPNCWSSSLTTKRPPAAASKNLKSAKTPYRTRAPTPNSSNEGVDSLASPSPPPVALLMSCINISSGDCGCESSASAGRGASSPAKAGHATWGLTGSRAPWSCAGPRNPRGAAKSTKQATSKATAACLRLKVLKVLA
mmetsp:Transcript_9107/g.16691  ORF Transcript_9107/g.16691 Transcript_9107/m.16691 type:complete len:233 (-) Transcript_9107:12-710(-)